ncbi:hypothetical protein D9V32_02600 [Mycetocola tolaasinivorans]|uniref:Four-carbon acid sugar kinase family protein n=1 Tax=Mycetocola tolaasinivorans TaxID=76635 RepID=A0A3L7AC23_9MICO|nr:four-carbon acid sugar kinase family protein [Mycetocola tolaasinivorans]RLP77360.1 hypothetical protein D9V32_02600 [Mycetocola tolaasinivorans]
MKTVVLDDDPTGTQSATNVRVLLETSVDLLEAALSQSNSVYVLTNSRAINEESAVALLERIRSEARAAAARLGEEVRFVLRGDSTLRGHVFAETEVFCEPDSVVLFAPAFPDGGRVTREGTHLVRIGGRDVPAHETEFANDPVFPFRSSVLAEYVAEKSDRPAIRISSERVRAGELADVLLTAAPRSVILPDVETNEDIVLIAEAIEEATRRAGAARVVVRSAAPLAAELAGVHSAGLLSTPLLAQRGRVLLVCGSHTIGATAQLAEVEREYGVATVIPTATALEDPSAAGLIAADAARGSLVDRGFTAVTTERVRSAEHNTLDHGERVMAALTTAVRALLPESDVIVSKGGITSADTARIGIGATSALVSGQILPGVSVWLLEGADGRSRPYVVVPGNVGDADTLKRVLDSLAAH